MSNTTPISSSRADSDSPLSVQRPSPGRQEAGSGHPQRQERYRSQSAYKDLLVYAGKVREYALAAIPELSAHKAQELADLFAGKVLAEKLARVVGLLEKVAPVGVRLALLL